MHLQQTSIHAHTDTGTHTHRHTHTQHTLTGGLVQSGPLAQDVQWVEQWVVTQQHDGAFGDEHLLTVLTAVKACNIHITIHALEAGNRMTKRHSHNKLVFKGHN